MSLRAGIITIGNEVVGGWRTDTHRQRLAREVVRAGGAVAFLLSVPDDVARIARAIDEGLREANILILTGGLGGTPDDVTREALAKAFRAPLRENARARARIAARFRTLGREIPAGALRQAEAPRGARLLPNPVGLAPGLVLARGAKRVVALPGVPAEFDAIVHGSLRAILERSARGVRPARRVLRTVGIGETSLAARIADLVDDEPSLVVGYLPDAAGVELSFSIAGRGAEERASRVVRAVKARLGDAVYATREEPIESIVLALLRRRGERVALAESFTGGLVSARFAAIPGASESWEGGVVAYSAALKRGVLGVPGALIAREGLVSEEVARAMAAGVRRRAGVAWGLATTGVAGPAPLEGRAPGTAIAAVAGP
ncbi:MAG: nicotinamide-nucleotide amidohydrolase family protein, partial [bacterium]